MLIPAHRPVLRHNKSTQKNITVPSTAVPMLQDCFERTNWQIFRVAGTIEGRVELEDYLSAVCSYISKCIDNVTVTRKITIRPNQKPWLKGEVRHLLKVRDAAFRSETHRH